MKLTTPTIPKEKILRLCQRYGALVMFVFAVGIYSFMILKIGDYTRGEPSQVAIDEKIAELKSTTIKDADVKVIMQLKGNSVPGQSSFDTSRNNPFKD